MARILIPDVTSFVRAQRKKRDPNLPSLLRANNRMEPSTVVQVLKAAEAVAESPVTVGVIEGGRKLFESAARARAGLPDTEGMSVDVPAELLPIEYEVPSPEDRMSMAQPAPAPARRGPGRAPAAPPTKEESLAAARAIRDRLGARGTEPINVGATREAKKRLAKEALANLNAEDQAKAISLAKAIKGASNPTMAQMIAQDAMAELGPAFNIALTTAALLRAEGVPIPVSISNYTMKSDIGKKAPAAKSAEPAPMPEGEVKGDVGVVDVPAATGGLGLSLDQGDKFIPTYADLPWSRLTPEALEALSQRNMGVPEPAAPAAPATKEPKFEGLVPGVEQIDVERIMARGAPAQAPLPDISELSDMARLSAFARGADTREKQQLALRAAAQLRRRPRNAFEALGIMERDPSEQLQLARQVASLFPGDDQVALIKARTGLEREATSRIKAIVDSFKTKGQLRKFLADTEKAYRDAELTAKKAKRFDEKVDAEIDKLKKELRYMDVRGAALTKQAEAAMLRARKYRVYPPVGRAPQLPPSTKATIEGWDKHLADLRKRLQKKVADRDKVATIPDPGPEPKVVAVGKDGQPLAVDENKPYFDWQRRKQEADTARSLTTSLDGAISDLERKITYAEDERKKLAEGFDAKSGTTTTSGDKSGTTTTPPTTKTKTPSTKKTKTPSSQVDKDAEFVKEP
jgi:hypothetical protein